MISGGAILLKNRFKHHLNGFTLAELIVVLAAMSSLSAIAIPNFLGYISNAENAKATMYLQSMKKSILNYHLETGQFPPDVNANQVPIQLSGSWYTANNMPFNGATDYEHWYVGNETCVVLIGWFGEDNVRDYPIHQKTPQNLEEESDDQVVTIAEYDCAHRHRRSIR